MPSPKGNQSKAKSSSRKGRGRRRDSHAERVLAMLVDLYEKQGVKAVWVVVGELLKGKEEDET